MMGHIHESLSTQPKAVEEVRAALAASVQRNIDDMEQVQRSITGVGRWDGKWEQEVGIYQTVIKPSSNCH